MEKTKRQLFKLLVMNLITLITLSCILTLSANEPLRNNITYDAPDQVIWHAPSKTWFVSNLGGGISLDKDSYGWISRTDEKGNIISPVWIGKEEGMHAPTGMTITDEFLYVVDRDGVYEIDIVNQKIAAFYPIPDGKFLNDIARASNGDLYVSDFFGNKIYIIPVGSKKPEVWLESNRLEAPDGLYMEQNSLIVASWGVLSEPGTFNTSKSGDLLNIDLKTKKISPLIKEVGNLEGIAKVGHCYFITDWASGKLLKVDPIEKTVVDFISGLRNPTDPYYSKELQILAFPQHGTNQVLFINIPE